MAVFKKRGTWYSRRKQACLCAINLVKWKVTFDWSSLESQHTSNHCCPVWTNNFIKEMIKRDKSCNTSEGLIEKQAGAGDSCVQTLNKINKYTSEPCWQVGSF